MNDNDIARERFEIACQDAGDDDLLDQLVMAHGANKFGSHADDIAILRREILGRMAAYPLLRADLEREVPAGGWKQIHEQQQRLPFVAWLAQRGIDDKADFPRLAEAHRAELVAEYHAQHPYN